MVRNDRPMLEWHLVAAARLAVPGDRVIVMAYAWCSGSEVRGAPVVVLVDARNRVAKVLAAEDFPSLDMTGPEK
ncbi:hypothetical protein Daud_0120 [Candidatus Desulforudis audaxviator MP104C]|uniref:Uncharacterized protein n=2 Tax=Candidatus Desulforudis TaxID=471826 RepID=B1I1G3_DESAP|nr:hypothetical protein Daud_0120 [Candidatus Desulforudis audaxviator MP104C]AZK58688.1 Aspartate 1-decarboxylase [Candidatus Desulforudis audaxviator]